MLPSQEHVGTVGWAGIAAGVYLFDKYASESLTHAFERGRESENKLIQAATIGALAVTAAHLLDVLPHRADPFYLIRDWKRHGESQMG